MTKSEAKYKIVKKFDKILERRRFFVYRKFLVIFWLNIVRRDTLEDAEYSIKRDKAYFESLKEKPELIGYY